MLYLVGRPIGNIKDITLRAIETLKDCDLIFCEDTRRSLNLLNHYQIKKPLYRYSDHIKETVNNIIKNISEGKKVALLTDGGMPNISDPGFAVVKAAIEKGIKVEVVGGVSAVINAMALSGFDGSSFVFLGFLERSDSRIIKTLETHFAFGLPIVLYESPNRIVNLVEILAKYFPNAYVVIAREMTKIYEEWIRGYPSEILDKIKKREIKGEITVVLKNLRDDRTDLSSIGFVCTGNTCRSVMAHYYALKIISEKKMDLNVSSAGILVEENAVCDHSLEILKKNGVEDFNHIPVQADRKFMEKNDLILTMTKKQRNILKGFFPEYALKIKTLLEYSGLGSGDIYDPFGKSYMEYELAFKNIKKAVDNIIESISKKS